MIGMAAIRVANIGAKRGDLDLRFSARAGVPGDDDDPELRSDGQAVRKELLDAIRRSIRRNVVIGRLALEQNIAHTPADEIGLMACLPQGAADIAGKGASVHSAIMREKASGWKLANEAGTKLRSVPARRG